MSLLQAGHCCRQEGQTTAAIRPLLLMCGQAGAAQGPLLLMGQAISGLTLSLHEMGVSQWLPTLNGIATVERELACTKVTCRDCTARTAC